MASKLGWPMRAPEREQAVKRIPPGHKCLSSPVLSPQEPLPGALLPVVGGGGPASPTPAEGCSGRGQRLVKLRKADSDLREPHVGSSRE